MKKLAFFAGLFLFVYLLSGCLYFKQSRVDTEGLSFILNNDNSVSIVALNELTGIDIFLNAAIDEEAVEVGKSLLKIVTRIDESTTRIAIASAWGNIMEGEEIVRISGSFTTLKNLVRSSSAKYIEIPSPKPQVKPPFPDGISIVDGNVDKSTGGYFLVHAEKASEFAGVEITITYDPQFISIDRSKGNEGVSPLNSFGTGLIIVQHTENTITITSAFNSAKNVDSEDIYQIHFVANPVEGKTTIELSGEVRDIDAELIQTAFHDGEIMVGGPKLLGDFNKNNKVDLPDFIFFARKFGSEFGDGDYDEIYDIAPAEDKYQGVWAGIYDKCTPDGKVDLLDFIIFARNYAKSKPNEPPFLAVPDQKVAQGETLELELLDYSYDPEGDALSFGLSSDSPGTLNDSLFSYTPDFDTIGNQIVEITVEDTAGNTMTDTFIIEVTKTNRPPISYGIPDQTIAEGETLDIELCDYFEDPDGDNLVFAVVSGVGTVVGSTYTYSPDYSAAGNYQITIKANDGKGGEVETTFTLTVQNTNRPPEEPQLLSPENTALLVNTSSAELIWNCSDPDNQLLTYDVYFGEAIETLEIISTQSATSLLVEGIVAGKTYYWMIIARDPFGDETSSEVFSFSTDYYLVPGGQFEGAISGYALMTKANSPFIITGDIIVESGAQLIIEPGVQLRFSYISDPENNGKEDTNVADLIVFGKLLANGSEEEPILFTSNETPALKGDWGGIRFSSSEGTSTISHATIEMAKDGVWTSSNCNIEISNCDIRTNIDYGVRLGNNSNATIVDSTIHHNTTGIYNYGTMIIRGSTISSNGGTGIYSNGVHIEIYETLIGENSSRGIILHNSSSNSRIQNCHILDNGSYGIEGYRFEVIDSSFARNGDYAINGSNYVVEGCTFRESEYGICGSSITVVDNTFEGEFSYGYYYYVGVYIGGQAVISHNAISGYSTGIWTDASSEVTIQDNLVTGNYRGIYFQNVNGQNLTCSNNNIYGNRDLNIYNNTNQRVAITDSFWGTDNENVIKNKIFDYYEDPNKGPVSFTGFKSSLVDGATSSQKIALIPYNRHTLGFVDEVTLSWTAYDPDGLLESFDLYFGDAEAPEIHTNDAISPVTVPVEHGKTYYSKIEGFNNQNTLEIESYVSKLYTGLTRVFGGSSSEEGYSVVETSDGGLVVTGYTRSFGDWYQVYLLKTDSTGNLLWEKNFGGSSGDYGYGVIETADGGLVVTGYTDSFGNNSQLYLLKTDSNGNLLWEKNFGGSNYDYGRSVVETADGGLVVTGYTNSGNQVYLLKTDSTGNLVWEKNFGGTDYDYGYSVVETADGGLVVTGETYSSGNSLQVYLLKTDSTGNLLWEKNFGGTSSDYGYSVVETADGGLVVTGETYSFGNSYQVYLLKTDSNGNLLWEKNFGGSSSDYGRSVVETADSGLVITGYTQSFGNNEQVYLLKTDSTGNLLWEENFGGTSDDYGRSVIETSDGGLVVTGYTNSYENGYQVYMIWTD